MINGKLFMTIASVLVALLSAASSFAQTAQIERELTLKDRAETWSQTVCLGELVTDGWVQSRCAVEREQCCRWNMNGMTSRELSRAEVARELSKVNFPGFTLKLKGAETIALTQTRRELRAEEIQAKIEATANAKYGDDAKGVAVTSIKLMSPMYVSLENESAWDVSLPEQATTDATVKIVSLANGGDQLGWARVTMKCEAEAYVAKKTVRSTDMLKPEDFELRMTDVLGAKAAGNAVFRKDQFPEAVRARVTLAPGALLTAASIERMPSVRLGDTVTLILRGDNLKISTKAVVQGTAAVGDMVTVQLSRYNRTFRGRLMEGRLVEVWL